MIQYTFRRRLLNFYVLYYLMIKMLILIWKEDIMVYDKDEGC